MSPTAAFAPSSAPSLGLSAITLSRPGWQIGNDWFGEAMPRKFAHHTGIEARAISVDDEVAMGVQAVRRLQRETGCDPADCRGLLFVSPSLLPPSIADRHLDPAAAALERPAAAARRVAAALGLPHCRTAGINWFCCGYSRALSILARRWGPRLRLHDDEYVLVVVATRISRITDYGARQTAGLFGDMASATLVAPTTSRRHPVHFEILHADAARVPVDRPAFDFRRCEEVTVPAPGGGEARDAARIVYELDGMAIADLAPRAMSAAVGEALAARGLTGADLDFVVPHQAGTGIVRFTGMQLDALGVRCEVVNGLVRDTGNTSACSIPHALHARWESLRGLVACPTAAVGSPGKPEVLQGCVLLRATALHERGAVAAA